MERNMMGSGLTGNQKEKTVETAGFQVKGHLLQWENVAIQISNISLVTSSDVQPTQFPIWGLLIVIVGIALIPFMLPVGILLLALGAFTFFVWYRENEKKKHQNHHADRVALGTNRDEREQTNGRLSCKIRFEEEAYYNARGGKS